MSHLQRNFQNMGISSNTLLNPPPPPPPPPPPSPPSLPPPTMTLVQVTLASHFIFGSYLLGTLAQPLLRKSPEPRVVFVSSGGMYNSKFPEWEVATSEKGKYNKEMAYVYAKRGQV